jgi:hypothetical protein
LLFYQFTSLGLAPVPPQLDQYKNDAAPIRNTTGLAVRGLVAFRDWPFGEWSPSEIDRSENGRLRRFVVRRMVGVPIKLPDPDLKFQIL